MDGKNGGDVDSQSNSTRVQMSQNLYQSGNTSTIRDAKLDKVPNTSTLSPRTRSMAHNEVNITLMTSVVDNFEPSNVKEAQE